MESKIIIKFITEGSATFEMVVDDGINSNQLLVVGSYLEMLGKQMIADNWMRQRMEKAQELKNQQQILKPKPGLIKPV